MEIQCCGGTGNILFQINFALYFNATYGRDVVMVLPGKNNAFDLHPYIRKTLDAMRMRYTHDNSFKSRFFRWTHGFARGITLEEQFGQIFESSTPIDSVTRLIGYWQDPFYFGAHSTSLYAALQLISETYSYKRLESWFYSQDRENCEIYFIHVRRGDYQNARNRSKHGFLTRDYYVSALDQLASRAKRPFALIVCSDDIEYAKSIIPEAGGDVHYVPSDFQDLSLETIVFLSNICNGGVLSNSTFSWWIANLIDIRNPNHSSLNFFPEFWYGVENLHHVTPAKTSVWTPVKLDFRILQ